MITKADLPIGQDNKICSNYGALKQRWYTKLLLVETLKHILLGEVGCTHQHINLLLLISLNGEWDIWIII